MKGYKKFFSYDRVNKGMHHTVKVTLQQYENHIMNILIDADIATRTNLDTVERIDIF